MRLFVMVTMLAAATLLETVSAGGAQAQPAKSLVGKWEGDIQQPRTRLSSDRTLIIESVGEGEGTVPVKGKYGITGQAPVPMEGALLEMTGGKASLRFTTVTGTTVVLQLHGEKDLMGTVKFRGTGPGLQEHPIRLKKVE